MRDKDEFSKTRRSNQQRVGTDHHRDTGLSVALWQSHTNWHETLNEVIERLEQAESEAKDKYNLTTIIEKIKSGIPREDLGFPISAEFYNSVLSMVEPQERSGEE